MKKATKLICLFLALILSLSLFTGCSGFGETEEDQVLEMKIGIPVSTKDEAFVTDWVPVLKVWTEDFADFNNIKLSFETVPSDEKGLAKFMKKVKSGKVALFFSDHNQAVTDAIANDAIVDYDDIKVKYANYFDEMNPAVKVLAVEEDLSSYMHPTYGTYQGLFFNSAIFEANQIAEPTSWATLLDAVAKLKAKGITPIAAGFADKGLEYMVDEMILSEGGTAEHSYQPTFGLMSSWERAAKDIKELEKAGAFTPDCYNVSFEDAKDSFISGDAAMIVAPASEMVEDIDMEETKIVAFPATSTGKRETGAFVGDISHGIYVSKACFNHTNSRYAEAIIELLGEDYMASADFTDLVMGDAAYTCNAAYYDEIAYSTFETSLNEMIGNATAADFPMRTYAASMDTTVEGFRKALTGKDMTAALQEATKAEIDAKAAKE